MLDFNAFFYRKISETGSCHWHSVYYTILKVVQSHVAVAFGEDHSLLADSGFDCKGCVNKESI